MEKISSKICFKFYKNFIFLCALKREMFIQANKTEQD